MVASTLASLVAGVAARHPDRPAVKLDDRVLDFAGLDDRAARVAGLLAAAGIEPGARVAVMVPNVPEFLVLYHGVLRAGAVVVPMNVMLKRREATFYLADSGAELMLYWHRCAAEATAAAADAGCPAIEVEPEAFDALLGDQGPRGPHPVEPADTAEILYTSGTTGRPKGATLSHGNLLENARISAEEILMLDPESVVLGVLPLFHASGQTLSMNAAISGGACLTMLPRFDPGGALRIIERDRVTHLQGVPTMYIALLNHPEREKFDVSSLRNCVIGAASTPAEVLREFGEAFDCELFEGYGLSEASPLASFNHPGRPSKIGSIGTPLRGVEMKIFDEHDREVPRGETGEIVVRGHNVMKGYWGLPEETAAALRGGWLHTGDMGRVDGDGYFFIVDRKKEMIIRGGYNVYPREVEEVLYEHPGVREAAVVGLPDARLGEEVGAAVVPTPGSEPDPAELVDFVRTRLAAYKYPRHVWFVHELPKGPSGKILKREIALPAV
ncbi:MAG: long-chain fatty acid--CoA ligase [Actinobacteria bacterium]|nr:long-chain fatty acid--CoA ligase [Actinomycetota bacterium]